MASAWRNLKNVFSRPLFTNIFRPKIVILDTDSILRVKTMYESVKLSFTMAEQILKCFESQWSIVSVFRPFLQMFLP